MGRRKLRVAVLGLATALVAVLALGAGYGIRGTVVLDCLRPATTVPLPLAIECSESNIRPSPRIMNLLQHQIDHYGLTLQMIRTCKTPRRLADGELGRPGIVLGRMTRERWLPMYAGCCTYSLGRQFAFLASDADANGSLIVEAVLVQNRWDYLRTNRR